GSVTGVAVDAQDRVWVVHRGVDSLQNNEKGPTLEPSASSCCFAAPQVLAFAAAGALTTAAGCSGCAPRACRRGPKAKTTARSGRKRRRGNAGRRLRRVMADGYGQWLMDIPSRIDDMPSAISHQP